jgi:hypothetical protein
MKVTRVKVKVGNIPLEGSNKFCVIWHILWQEAWPGLLDDRCPTGRPLHVRGFGALVLVSCHLDTCRRGVRLQTGAYHLRNYQLNCTFDISSLLAGVCSCSRVSMRAGSNAFQSDCWFPSVGFLLMTARVITCSERCVAGILRGGFRVDLQEAEEGLTASLPSVEHGTEGRPLLPGVQRLNHAKW